MKIEQVESLARAGLEGQQIMREEWDRRHADTVKRFDAQTDLLMTIARHTSRRVRKLERR